MNELLRLGAFELAEKIRDGEVTPVDVVTAHIERQKEVNPKLNAIVEERYDVALRDAHEKTEALAKSGAKELPPLYGVPFTVKEMLSVEGMKRTAGSTHRRELRTDFDATLVGRMKKAGAIPLATTNVPELGFWFETENPIYGRTNNPYDVTRTSGGSSGGEGAMIGAGGSPFGLGSDIGGSIRLPAALCGVSGHKPTNRLLPLTGHYPYNREDMATLMGRTYPYTSTGPLARKAKDLRPLTELMMGPDEFDRETLKATFHPPLQDPSQLKVFVCEAPAIHLTRPTDENVRRGVRESARLFEQLGAPVEELNPRLFVRAVELWAAAIKSTKEERTFAQNLSPDGPVNVAMELFRAFTGKSRYTVPSLLTVLVEQKAGSDTEAIRKNLEDLEALRAEFNQILGPNGILLCPVHSRTAPKHRAPWLSPFDFVYTGVFNVLGNPATAVPVGMSEGLPLSTQIVAAPFHDHLTLSAAEILEDSFGGWTPPEI